MWAERFKILFNGNFKVSKSKTVETILMRKVGMLPYFCDKKAKFAVAFIPYLSSKYIGKIEMGVLLPDDGANIDSFAEYLRNDSLQQMRSKALFRTLDVILPKFKVEASINLIPIAMRMGLTSAFTSKADFSGIRFVSEHDSTFECFTVAPMYHFHS